MKKILLKAIENYGSDLQLDVAIEEMSELIKEICKYKRGKFNLNNIVEEVADCYIVLESIKIIFGLTDTLVKSNMNIKIERLKNNLNKECS